MFEIKTGELGSTILLGAGLMLVWPIVAPIIRPVTKAVIKTGIAIGQGTYNLAAGAVENVGDIAAEANHELNGGRAPTTLSP